MKITYRREMKHNYLIIDPEELEWQGYESGMLARNTIEGLLMFRIQQMEDGVRFYYDITSKQPLDRLMQNQKLGAEDIRSLLIGISGTLERMEGYLLCEKTILFTPEFIYVDPDSFRVGLCMVPGMERDFPEDFGKLLEKILESVDHQDKETVVLAYGIYQETRKDNYGLNDVMRFLYRQADPSSSDPQKARQKPEMFDAQKQPKRPDLSSPHEQEALYQPQEKERGRKGNHDKPLRERKQNGWWYRVRMWIIQKLHHESQEDMPVQVPWEMMFHEDEYEEKELPAERLFSERISRQGMEVQERNMDGEVQGTVLLADLSADTGNRVLRALSAGVEDIPIAYYPFIIGKQENLVDYRLDRDTVSRLHLRIDRNGDEYEIQDLNSTNGTMLRGRVLINNETDKLQIGDEISIARFRYRFE